MKKKFKNRIVSFITAMLFVISGIGGAIPAMAAEVDDTTNFTAESMQYTEEAEMLRSKIDELIIKENQARETYKTDYWGSVEVTGEHTGAWHSIYGHQARMCVAYKPLDGNAALSVNLNSGFDAWTVHYSPWNTDADGYCMYVGEWRSVSYANAYRMNYQLFTTGGSFATEEGERTGSFHVWIDYK